MAIKWDTESITNRLLNRLRSKEEWKEVLFESTNLNLIKSFSEELNYALNYNEYLFMENKWSKAQNKSSLLSFSDLHRYKAHRKVSSKGTLRLALDEDVLKAYDWDEDFVYINEDQVAYLGKYYEIDKPVWETGTAYSTGDIVYYEVNQKFYEAKMNLTPSVDNPADTPLEWAEYTVVGKNPVTYSDIWDRVNIAPTVNVVIPAFTSFGGDVKFVNIETYQFTADLDYIDIEVVQGEKKLYQETANGDINEIFEIVNDSIENSNYWCNVNGVVYSEIDSLFNASLTEAVFEIEDKFNLSGIYLIFGDDINGLKVNNGDIVQFEYLETLGIDGDILGIGLVDSVNDTIYNADNESVGIYCRNMGSIIGGADFESLESIREKAPLTFQTGDRATTKDDYKTIIFNNPDITITNVNVWGVYETNIDEGSDIWEFVPTNDNKVFITALNSVYQPIDSADKLTLSEYINEKKAPTDILDFIDTEIILLKVESDVYVSDKSYLLNDVKLDIQEALASVYSIENNTYKKNLRFSDIYALVDNVAGVDYHYTTYKLIKKTTFTKKTMVTHPFTDFISISTTIPVTEIQVSTVKIYYKDALDSTNDILVAYDDGAGAFTFHGDFTEHGSSSSIDYIDGVEYYNLRIPHLLKLKIPMIIIIFIFIMKMLIKMLFC